MNLKYRVALGNNHSKFKVYNALPLVKSILSQVCMLLSPVNIVTIKNLSLKIEGNVTICNKLFSCRCLIFIKRDVSWSGRDQRMTVVLPLNIILLISMTLWRLRGFPAEDLQSQVSWPICLYQWVKRNYC